MTTQAMVTTVLLLVQILGGCGLLYAHRAAQAVRGTPPAWVVLSQAFTGSLLQRAALELLVFGAACVVWFLVSASGAASGAVASFFLVDAAQGLWVLGALVRVWRSKGVQP